MSLDLQNFGDADLTEEYISYLIEQESLDAYLHFSRLWEYFRNPILPASGLTADALNTNSRPYFQAQEMGLPARITGLQRSAGGGAEVTGLARKEVVIENDIAWRVQTMIDFLFGKPISIRSLATDPATAAAIESVITSLIDANGGSRFFQELALLGAIYGFADVVLRFPPDWPGQSITPASLPAPPPAGGSGSETSGPASSPVTSSVDLARAVHLAGQLVLESVEATRILPVLDDNDYRHVRYWVQCYRKQVPALQQAEAPSFSWAGGRDVAPRTVEVVEIIGPRWCQRYEDRQLVWEGPNTLGTLPVVHIQNVSLPGSYEGLSDVEPLLPLQDELNTRLSDRACRVTYQSFKMYLAKGIEDFLQRPVGPGQMWATHNMEASIQEFGHDGGSPSEDVHIEHVRQALDKVSGVSPLAAGLVKGAVGNLSSATALKMLLSGLLARTERKRTTYGQGIAQIVELTLTALDRLGALRTKPQDRRVEIHWPSPLPEDESQRLANAQIKAALGVPAERILAELGYDRQVAEQA